MAAVTAPPRHGPGTGTQPEPSPARPRRGVRSPWILLAGAGLLLATVAGGTALAPAYAAPGRVYAVLAVCSLASVAITLLVRARTTALLTVLAGLPVPLAAVVGVAVWLPGDGEGVLRGAGEAILHSGARILTSTAPTPLNVDTLTLPLLATWLTGTASALAWHSRRQALALLPGLMLLVGAVVLNGPVTPPGFVSIGMYGVAATVIMSVTRQGGTSRDGAGAPTAFKVGVETAQRSTRAAAVRRTLLTAGAGLLAAATTVLGGPVLLAAWAAEPGDPRTAFTPPTEPTEALNPLGYLSGWAAEPDDLLLTVTAPEPVELRWVALADFTGTTWLPEGGYRTASQVLPEPVPPPPGATDVPAGITVGEDLPGNWVPVVGAPRRVELPSPGYDAVTGTVVNMDGGVAGTEYEVVGDVADWRSADMADAAQPEGDIYEIYRALPPGAPAILNEVVAAVASEGSSYARANAIAEYLRESHSFDPETPGGHGYAHVDAILAAPGDQGGGGTSEQFASAFALLARAAGLPSRVAVGFAPGTDQGGGEYAVHTGDAAAWGEVYFDGIGWVPFSVTPGGEEEGGAEGSPEGSDHSDSADAEEDEGSEADSAHDIHSPQSGTEQEGPLWWVVILSAGAVLLAVLAIPVARLARRARRLGSGQPPDRVLGAWREARDDLRLGGHPPPPGLTVSEIVALADGALPGDGRGGAGLDELGRAVNGVGFGGGDGIDDATADGAAAAVRRHQRALRAGRSRFKRPLWWFDPRPLLWRGP